MQGFKLRLDHVCLLLCSHHKVDCLPSAHLGKGCCFKGLSSLELMADFACTCTLWILCSSSLTFLLKIPRMNSHTITSFELSELLLNQLDPVIPVLGSLLRFICFVTHLRVFQAVGSVTAVSCQHRLAMVLNKCQGHCQGHRLINNGFANSSHSCNYQKVQQEMKEVHSRFTAFLLQDMWARTTCINRVREERQTP